MKKGKYPRFRSVTRRGKGGQIWVYFRYDMRGTGKPDINLGSDYALALQEWHKLHNHIPLTVGRLQEAFDKWRELVLPTYKAKSTHDAYKQNLARIEPVFGQAAWHEITVPVLLEYLQRKKAKTQGNRDLALLSVVWGWARRWGMTALPWPAAGLKGWKNPEKKRQVEVTDAMFNAMYEQADRLLRDAMDIATSTGLRITDVRTIRMPSNGVLRFKANKTGKIAEFDVSQSPVLTALVERREAMKAHSVMLLATDTGRQATERMLDTRWQDAKAKAIKANPRLIDELTGLYLRDMRKRASNLAGSLDAASELLQHSSKKITSDHYYTAPVKLRTVR